MRGERARSFFKYDCLVFLGTVLREWSKTCGYPETVWIPSICRFRVFLRVIFDPRTEKIFIPQRRDLSTRRIFADKKEQGMLHFGKRLLNITFIHQLNDEFVDSLPHISLRMTRSAWTTPDQRVCWLRCGDLMQVVFKSHVDDAGLVMRRRVVMFDADQVRMPYMRGTVVDAGGVVVTVEKKRGSFGARDRELAGDVDYLWRMMLRKGGKKLDILIIKHFIFKITWRNSNCTNA